MNASTQTQCAVNNPEDCFGLCPCGERNGLFAGQVQLIQRLLATLSTAHNIVAGHDPWRPASEVAALIHGEIVQLQKALEAHANGDGANTLKIEICSDDEATGAAA